jgi:hypothetical protein
VGVAPGVNFDTVDGGTVVRMRFAGDGDEIMRAVDLPGEWLTRRPQTR